MKQSNELSFKAEEYEKNQIFEALTRFNYLPNQKSDFPEIPPCFNSRRFTPEVAERLSTIEQHPDRKKLAYDLVEYSITRHNNAPRVLGIPHPHPYSHLAKKIVSSWDKISYITDNKNSQIKPGIYDDGRIIVMNYDSLEEKTSKILENSFGKKFRVEADISSCFQNIYTHSLPWAIVNLEEAKKNFSTSIWYNAIDLYQRRTKRNETVGVPIGPATSSIFVELILSSVDKKLSSLNFNFTRYIDDYICFCTTHDQAQQFTIELSNELRKLKLSLNSHKTKIVELPEPLNDRWVIELANNFPNIFIDEDLKSRTLTFSESINYIDYALNLKKECPDGSIIKYAVKKIIDHIDECDSSVFDYIINLSWHFPIILPCLEKIFDFKNFNAKDYEKKINEIIYENSKYRRSDGMSWGLYYIKKYKLKLELKTFEAVLETKDCLSILLLYKHGMMQSKIIEFAKQIALKDIYTIDQYWILLYELYYDRKILSPYQDRCFRTMRNLDVTFLPPDDKKSKSEQDCEAKRIEFLESFIFFHNGT